MVNLKLGGVLLVAGAALFLLSDTLFGDSNLAAYSIIAGLVLFPLGIVLALVGIIQVIIAKVKERKREE